MKKVLYFWNWLQSWFQNPFKTGRVESVIPQHKVKLFVRLYSKGSIFLQTGRYLTEEEWVKRSRKSHDLSWL